MYFYTKDEQAQMQFNNNIRCIEIVYVHRNKIAQYRLITT